MEKQPSITVDELYDQIKQLTLESHVSYYGDESIKNLPISTFFGTSSSSLSQTFRSVTKLGNQRKTSEKASKFLSLLVLRLRFKISVVKRKLINLTLL